MQGCRTFCKSNAEDAGALCIQAHVHCAMQHHEQGIFHWTMYKESFYEIMTLLIFDPNITHENSAMPISTLWCLRPNRSRAGFDAYPPRSLVQAT